MNWQKDRFAHNVNSRQALAELRHRTELRPLYVYIKRIWGIVLQGFTTGIEGESTIFSMFPRYETFFGNFDNTTAIYHGNVNKWKTFNAAFHNRKSSKSVHSSIWSLNILSEKAKLIFNENTLFRKTTFLLICFFFFRLKLNCR